MSVEIYLNFNGNCREAVEFYANAFNTKLERILTFGETPNPNLPEEAKNLILHTFLMINGSKIMFSDTMPGYPFTQGNNISLTVMSKDVDEVKQIFNKLKVGGKVSMELQETFFSKCYGMLVDKFGVCWQVNAEKVH